MSKVPCQTIFTTNSQAIIQKHYQTTIHPPKTNCTKSNKKVSSDLREIYQKLNTHFTLNISKCVYKSTISKIYQNPKICLNRICIKGEAIFG
jgi:hypothetical protein